MLATSKAHPLEHMNHIKKDKTRTQSRRVERLRNNSRLAAEVSSIAQSITFHSPLVVAEVQHQVVCPGDPN
jgi:hypothetical protein